MKIKVLGTRGEIEESLPYHSKHSGVLIDDQLLLDLGEKEFLKYQPCWILISHLHPDHAYFARWKEEEVPLTSAPIYAPEEAKHQKLHSLLHVLTQPLKIEEYVIVPIPTHHSKTVKSQGYLIKKGATKIFYTGDLIWIDKEYHPLFEGIDLVITEASFFHKGGMIRKDKETSQLYGHTGMPNIIDLFKKYTKAFLFIHFGAWFYKNVKESQKKIALLAKEKGVRAWVGYDGQELNI